MRCCEPLRNELRGVRARRGGGYAAERPSAMSDVLGAVTLGHVFALPRGAQGASSGHAQLHNPQPAKPREGGPLPKACDLLGERLSGRGWKRLGRQEVGQMGVLM